MSAGEQALELRRVAGPSAFEGEWRRARDLLWMMCVTEFRSQYANTALGFMWTIVRPLVFFGVIFLVIREILRFGAGVENYGLILVLNLILFTYFQDATSRAVRSVSQRESMVRRMQFPRIVIPLSVSLTAAFSMLINLVALFPLLLAFGLQPQWTWVLFPLVLAALFVLTTALTMILSVLFVRSRDTAQAWSLISRLLFYASPVLFPIELVPDSFQQVIAANPIAPILEAARVWVIDPSAPDPIGQVGILFGIVVPAALYVAICVSAVVLFRRHAPRFAEEL